MMMAISLPFLLLFSLVVSGVLMWLNSGGAGFGRAAAATLALCLATIIVFVVASGSRAVTRQIVMLWVFLMFLPAAAVLGVSRLGTLMTRPRLLLVLGPITYLVAAIVFTMVYNILYASNRSG